MIIESHGLLYQYLCAFFIEIKKEHQGLFNISDTLFCPSSLYLTILGLVYHYLTILGLLHYKLTFIISPLGKKLEKKLNNSYIKKYSETIETNRYLDTASNDKSRVNHPNHNTQYNEPYNIERNKYEKWCVNVSDVDIPTYVIDTLKLGEKFNFNDTFDKNLTLQYLKNFETFANNYIDDNKISKVRGTFLNKIKKPLSIHWHLAWHGVVHAHKNRTQIHYTQKNEIVILCTKHFIFCT